MTTARTELKTLQDSMLQMQKTLEGIRRRDNANFKLKTLSIE